MFYLFLAFPYEYSCLSYDVLPIYQEDKHSEHQIRCLCIFSLNCFRKGWWGNRILAV